MSRAVAFARQLAAKGRKERRAQRVVQALVGVVHFAHVHDVATVCGLDLQDEWPVPEDQWTSSGQVTCPTCVYLQEKAALNAL